MDALHERLKPGVTQHELAAGETVRITSTVTGRLHRIAREYFVC